MAQSGGKSSVPSGWYPDPNNSSINRWWSGSEWTRDVSPREIVQEVVSSADSAIRAAVSRGAADAETAVRARLADASADAEAEVRSRLADASTDASTRASSLAAEARAGLDSFAGQKKPGTTATTSRPSTAARPTGFASAAAPTAVPAAIPTATPTAAPTAARPGAARPATTPPANSAASYAASSARPSAPAEPFRPPARSRPAPEISQPPYAFNRTMSTCALITVVVGLGLIAGLLLN